MSKRPHFRGSLIPLLVTAMLAYLPGAAAEVRVTEARSGKLMVEAHNATVQEVLEALRASRSIEIHSSDALSRTITGTYSGTLEHVLGRILDGYDRVIRSTASGVRLDIVTPEAFAKTADNNAPPTMQPGPPALRPLPVQQHQPRIVRGWLDLDGELQ